MSSAPVQSEAVPPGHGDAPAISARTDLVLAAVFLAFGAAVVIASAAMPTFTDQGTPLYVAPGLVPAFHGIVIAILSVLLAVRSITRGALRTAEARAPGVRGSTRRIALAAVLAIGFALGLVGRIPFWIAATGFVFCFICAFEYAAGQTSAVRSKNAGLALAIGLCTGVGITLVFERIFLIRMP